MAGGRKAARVNDAQACPAIEPHWYRKDEPHVGGAVTFPANLRVMISGSPAAHQGSGTSCKVGDLGRLMTGEPSVLVGGIPIARQWEPTTHGGVVTKGASTVQIGTLSDLDWILLAIARIKASAFGQSAEGQRVIDKLEQMADDGKISFAKPGAANEAEYDPNDQTITLDRDGQGDVDRNASQLAHEGTHAADDDDNRFPGDSKETQLARERHAFDNQSELYKEQSHNDRALNEMKNPANRDDVIKKMYGF